MTSPARTIIAVVGVSLLTAGLLWFPRAYFTVEKHRVTLIGSSGSSDGLQYSTGSLVVERPNPGVFFATVRTPSDPEERFSYLMLFRYGGAGKDGQDQARHSGGVVDARTVETKDALTIGGKRAEVNYRLKLDETRSRPETETVQLVGKDWDLAAGRVFLIDFAAETPVVTQKNVPLPKIPAPLKSTQAAEQLAKVLKEELGRNDPEIDGFLRMR